MRPLNLLPGTAACGLLLLAGCSLSPLAKNTAAFSRSTGLVVDNTENAYRAAVRLDLEEQTEKMTAHFGTSDPIDPHTIKPLIDERGLMVRTKILDGLRTYAVRLAALTSGASPKGLDEAAAACGVNLQSLGNSASAALASSFTVSQDEANGAATALKALGDLLAKREVKKEVPGVIREMDPNVQAIATLLESDIATLRQQSANNYEQLLAQQDSFVQHSIGALSPIERRAEIGRMLRIALRKNATDARLSDLEGSIKKLALAHHALAEAATSKDNPSLTASLAELRASAESLSSYYDSLSSKEKE
jgi:hypothetical protein